MARKLMVIDTDCGVDDALAIMLALTFRDTWEIVAITCVNGNTSVDNACSNVLRVLEVCNDKEQIPVYRGCDRSLLFEAPCETMVHGDDGLGNVAKDYSMGDRKISQGHAANVLVELAKKHKGQIHLIALGPFTNLALAHRLDPDFTVNLKALTFMGGNVYAEGNTTSAAEFNFFCDPESAHIILAEVKCPVTMIPWETTVLNSMPWEFYDIWIDNNTHTGKFVCDITMGRANVFKKRIADQIASESKADFDERAQEGTKMANFAKDITQEWSVMARRKRRNGFLDCDFLAVAATVNHLSIKSKEVYPITVETSGKFTRGLALIERRKKSIPGQPDIEIITAMDDLVLKTLRSRIV